MAKTSASMETVVLSKTNEALSEGQRRRQNSVRNNEYAKGYYLFLPMKHFCTDVVYNNQPMKSKRVAVVKLDDNGNVEYPRTWKVSYFTESLTCLKEQGMPTGIKTEIQTDGLRHIVRGQLSSPIASTTSRIPKSVTADGFLHIDEPFVINYHGIRQGYMPDFTEDNGVYQVKADENGNALFQAANITDFEVTDAIKITDELVAAAKRCIANDPQLKGVKVD